MAIDYKFPIFKLDGDGATDRVIKELRYLIKTKAIIPENFKVATLFYDTSKGIGMEGSPFFYPLKFVNGEEEVWLSSVTSGYTGTGPRGTLEALELMGFDVTEKIKELVLKKVYTDEIFTK